MMLVTFDFYVSVEHPALSGHFPGCPIVPGVLLLDEVMSGVNRSGDFHVAGLREVKLLAVMHPGELATTCCDTNSGAFEVSVIRSGTRTVLAKGSLLRDISS
jgi:3-hydroxyacyl-[acyl-carrier-protein] dehydratase